MSDELCGLIYIIMKEDGIMPCFACKPTCQLCRRKPTLRVVSLCPECGWYNTAESGKCKKCGVVLSPLPAEEIAKKLAPQMTLAQCFLCSPLDNPRCEKCMHIARVRCRRCETLNIAGKKLCRKCGFDLPAKPVI